MIFRNPQLLALLLLLPVLLLVWRWRGMRLVPLALALRLLGVALLVLALADPVVGREEPPPGPLVILVDQSDSLTATGQAALREEALRLSQAAGERATLIWFGANVVAGELPAASDTTNAGDGTAALLPPIPQLDATGSDLAAALRTARELLTPTGGRIVLLSDGVPTTGDALAEAQAAAAAGLTIDVQPVTGVQVPELFIRAMSVPRTLRVGEEYPVQIQAVFNPGAQSNGGGALTTLRLWEGERLLAEQEVVLMPGDNDFTFRHRAIEPGVVRLRTEIAGSPDTFGRNNSAAATALVAPPPQVLLVEGRAGMAQSLSAALQREGIASRTIAADRLPTRLSDLDAYNGMVLLDVPAAALSLDQMASVREFVRSEGRGLVVTGGRNSFGLGAYANTPLEETLPVMMEPPPRPQRTDIGLLLIVDRSASMLSDVGVSKFDMAKEAAILSTETLQAEDRIGILAFDTGQLWVVPFQQIGQGLGLQQIQDAIATLPSGGGTDIYAALEAGLPELARQPVSVRHAVLLTDGRSFTNDRAAYQRLVELARAQEISLSTIAIGRDSDTELLDLLAQWGGGRYYFADAPEDIPRLTLLESEIARADPVVEETFRADLSVPHPILRDFAPAELPELDGYVATTPKDTAEVVLRSPQEDPVLVSWQYGLGRAIAWTPSVDAPWANGWLGWGDYGRFWAQLVRYTLPEPDSGPLQVRVEPQPGGARLTVDTLQPGGAPLDLAQVTARITLPDGNVRDFSVRQVAPGRYAQDLRLVSDGPYTVAVLLVRDNLRQQAEIGYVHSAPAEYYPPAAGAAQATGSALLAQIAALTGGQVLDETLPLPSAVEGVAPTRPAAVTALWPWLLAAALLVWLLEIAVRRGLLLRR